MPKNAQTYILVGDDFVGTDSPVEPTRPVEPINLEAAQAQGVIVINVKDYSSIKEAVGQIHGPANVILAAHGNQNGSFKWSNNSPRVPYYGFFRALVWQKEKGTDIRSVTIESCYGGLAQNVSELAPAGTVIQSMVSPLTVGWENTIRGFTQSVSGSSNQADLFIHVLGQFEPKEFHDHAAYWNHEHPNLKYDDNPLNAIPRIIGIGGPYGEKIDLDIETEKLQAQLINHTINQRQWDDIVKNAKGKFGNVVQGYGFDLGPDGAFKGYSKGTISFTAFDEVAAKMARGEALGTASDPIKAAEELRLAYAITASYLDKFEMESRIQTAQAGEKLAREFVSDERKGADAPGTPANIVKTVQRIVGAKQTGRMDDQTIARYNTNGPNK